ncbi:MAG: transposase [Patescibacteria group bacterium]
MKYKTTGESSFFGDFLYDQVLPHEHFLVRLRREVDWRDLCTGLMSAYKGGGEYGPRAYAPDLLLRYLLVPYLFDISERETEQLVRVHLLAKYFVGLGVDQLPPDHSTLTVFKTRVSKLKAGRGYSTFWDKIFSKVLEEAKQKGIVLGSVQVIDSTHTTANVNLVKEKDKKEKGTPLRDPDAKGGVKRMETRTFKTKQGKKIKVRVPQTIYGYKTHASLNASSGLVTSITTTSANESDTKQFIPLVNKDQKKKLNTQAYAADRGYDDGDNHYHCQTKDIVPAIALKITRTKPIWQELKAVPLYQEALKLRYRIEAKFGEAKTRHGFSRCRYLGLSNYHVQAILTTLTLNLKRMMTLTEQTHTREYCIQPIFVRT